MTIGIALLGAGIFAREEHLPAIEASPLLSLKAVYSRSQSSATALAAASSSPSTVDLYFDSPAAGGKTLADLLARADIAAIIVVLPILSQPSVIAQAIDAGKHVLSEKPIAGEVAGAAKLVEWYAARDSQTKPIWSVAENFRYVKSLRHAADKLATIGGTVTTFRLQMNAFVKTDNKYFNTEWRKTPTHQGGFLLDGGVHFVAGLRQLLGALPQAPQRIVSLAGFSALLEARLPPVDTVHAVALTQDGKAGTIAISFGTEFRSGLEIEVVTTNGAVTWTQTTVKTVTRDQLGDKVETNEEFVYDSGVKAEVAAFAEAIEKAKGGDPRQSPEEALRDLEILQRLLESGEGGAVVKAIEY
ncbi:hypothetical protein B0T17DRAFT_182094 [Bombardia bombarda]|uniref:Oxidoreductase n=1 Tax=Bombardia bombarda TaxID=252184 RepID=A0AA40C8A7_9PEZI|nr:hypothetical protein B0T17DRAFT_182094 [Bombardia bombarda]